MTEAFNPAGHLYEVNRLLEGREAEADKPPRELMLAVTSGVDDFANGAVQSDDITCLAVRRAAA